MDIRLRGHIILILGEVILFPQLSFLFLALGSEVAFPAWTEVNVPTPELA